MAKSMIQTREDEKMWITMSDSFASTVQNDLTGILDRAE